MAARIVGSNLVNYPVIPQYVLTTSHNIKGLYAFRYLLTSRFLILVAII